MNNQLVREILSNTVVGYSGKFVTSSHITNFSEFTKFHAFMVVLLSDLNANRVIVTNPFSPLNHPP
jgi:hypothetical protein